MVILQIHLAILWAAVGRVHKKYTRTEAVTVVVMIMLLSQVLIWIATAAVYMTHSSTYFNYPAALNQRTTVSFGEAMLIRAGGLIGNCIMGASETNWGRTPNPKQVFGVRPQILLLRAEDSVLGSFCHTEL